MLPWITPGRFSCNPSQPIRLEDADIAVMGELDVARTTTTELAAYTHF
jgi:hypothetical protein